MTYVLKVHGSERDLLSTEYSDVCARAAKAMAEWYGGEFGELDQPIIDVYENTTGRWELVEQWGFTTEYAIAIRRLDKPSDS